MARNVSDEELQLKKRARRRLVGAVVLVTTVAVVLPMVLDSEPRPANQSINIQIPAQDAGVIAKTPAPLKPAEPAAPAAEATKPETKPEAAPPVAAVAPKAEPKVEAKAKPESKPEVKAEAKPAETKVAETKPVETKAAETKATETKAPAKPAESKPAEIKPAKAETPKAKEVAKATGGFVIQVAALSDAAKAKELQAKIAGGGLKAYTEVVQTSKGPVTRVRVGPYASREAAEKARPQLQKLQLDGKVVPR
ncbi:MAG: SPOR domain-containing protein [Burkholderiales bacterium]|nr:SPOR domain-containing protein [Burkholderiales bacterium]